MSDPATAGVPLGRLFSWSVVVYAVALLAGLRIDMMPAGLAGLPLLIVLVALLVRGESPTLDTVPGRRLLLALVLWQGLGWLAVIVVQYWSVSFNISDTGYFAHLVANTAGGRGFVSSIFQRPAWVDHFAPNLVLVAPLHRIWPSFLWLPILRWLGWLACLPILWRLSEHFLQDLRLRRLVLVLWLVGLPLARVLAFEFQPSSLAVPFVLLAFLWFREGRPWLALAVLVFVLGFKEQMGLAWLSVGIWLVVERRQPRRGLAVAAVGVAAGLAIVYLISPWLAGGVENVHLGRFGPFALIGAKLGFVLQLLLSVGFIPLLAPCSLLYLLPACAISLVSDNPGMVTLDYHYQDLPATVLFVAVLSGLHAWQAREGWAFRLPARPRAALVVLAVAAMLFFNNYAPLRVARAEWPTAADLATVHELRAVRGALDPERGLWTLDSLGPYLVDHPGLRPIHRWDEPLQDPLPHTAVVADEVDHWPLGEGYRKLRQGLDAAVEEGRYEPHPDTDRLRVYLTIDAQSQ